MELAEYCRQRGLFVEQVESWRDACIQVNGGVAQEATRLQKELRQKDKEIKQLQRDLRRKETVLAETAALLVLRQKAYAIWGDGEDAGSQDGYRADRISDCSRCSRDNDLPGDRHQPANVLTLAKCKKATGGWATSRKTHAKRLVPYNKLNEDEVKAILTIVSLPEFPKPFADTDCTLSSGSRHLFGV